MQVHSEELVLSVQSLPCSSKRLTARSKSWVGRLDTAWVELEFWAGENLVRIEWSTKIGLAKAQDIRFIQVSLTDVSAWLAAIQEVDGEDFGECVFDARDVVDCVYKSREGQVCSDNWYTLA